MDVLLGPVVASAPAHPEFARTIRLLVANVAASAGLPYDRVDDAALAANEAFGLLIRPHGATTVECEATCGDHWIDVALRSAGSTVTGPGSEPWPDDLAGRVLAGTTDDVEYRPDEPAIRFRLTGS